MRRAIELAEGGRGSVSPNPLVGAVIVRGDEILGSGYHAEYGGIHAEVAALEAAAANGKDVTGATMYVSLEPCAHHGKQPPCADAIIKAGIGRVVIGCDDPSGKTAGIGPRRLEEAGIKVDFASGDLATMAKQLIQPFRKYARTGRPLVTLKAAMSLDGKISTATGDSRWISGDRSRLTVHQWRAEAGAIAIGIGTALADDPLLTARNVNATRQPIRVIFDPHARLPIESRLVKSIDEAPLLLVAGAGAPPEKIEALREAGVEVLNPRAGRDERLALTLDHLGRRNVNWMILEGGSTLAGAFIANRLVDELRLFFAPILIGGETAPGFATWKGVEYVAEAQRASGLEWAPSGEDLYVHARLQEW